MQRSCALEGCLCHPCFCYLHCVPYLLCQLAEPIKALTLVCSSSSIASVAMLLPKRACCCCHCCQPGPACGLQVQVHSQQHTAGVKQAIARSKICHNRNKRQQCAQW